MSVTIVEAEHSHIPEITAIYRTAVLTHTASFELHAPDEAEMARRMDAIRADGYPYIAVVDGEARLLGYAYASSYRSRPGYRWTVEDTVYIEEAARGRGIGTMLLTEIIERCTALGFRQMIGIVGGSDHLPSIRLHEKLGFERVGLLPATGFKHDKWLDSVVLQRALGNGDGTHPDPDVYPGTLYARPASG